MQTVAKISSSTSQTIYQAFIHHPKTAVALTTLFFAKVVEANTGDAAQRGTIGAFIDWLSQDTGLKVGVGVGVGVVSLTAAFALWRLRKGNVEKTPQKLDRAAASTLKKHDNRTKGGGSEGSKGLPRPAQGPEEQSTVVKRPAAVQKKGDGPKIKRVVEFEVPPTPGKVDFDPFQMRETTERALKASFTWPRQHGLLCYLLAARMMQQQKFAEAKIESKKGYKIVEKSNGDEALRAQFLLQIQQCQFAGAQAGHANSNHAAAKRKEEIIPETPGVVTLSPAQMLDNAVDDLIPLFIKYDQYAQLCLLVAVDLMLANDFQRAKAIAKKGYYLRTWADDNVRISTKMGEKCGKAPKDLKGTETGKKFEDLMSKCNDLIKVQEQQAKARAKKPLTKAKDEARVAQKGAVGEATKEAPEPDSPPPPPPPREESEEFEESVMQINRDGPKFTQSVQQEEGAIEEGANTNAPKAPPPPEPNFVNQRPLSKQASTGASVAPKEKSAAVSKKPATMVPPTPSKLPPPPENTGGAKVDLPKNLPPPPKSLQGLPKPVSAEEPVRSGTPPQADEGIQDEDVVEEEKREPKTPLDLAKIRAEDAQAESRKKVFTALKDRKGRTDEDVTKKEGLNPVTPPTVAREKKKEAAKTAGWNEGMANRRKAVAHSDDEDSWSE